METEKKILIDNQYGKLILDPFQTVFYMQYNCQKFWEITLEGLHTIIRIGKLTDEGEKDLETMQIFQKKHQSLEMARKYINLQVSWKRAKGYDLKNRDLFANDRTSFQNNNLIIQESSIMQENNEEENYDVNCLEKSSNNQIYALIEIMNNFIKVTKNQDNKTKSQKIQYFEFSSPQNAKDFFKSLKKDLEGEGYKDAVNNKQYKQFNIEEVTGTKNKNNQPKGKVQKQKKNSVGTGSTQAGPKITVTNANQNKQQDSDQNKNNNNSSNFLQVFNYDDDNKSRATSLSDMTDNIQSRSQSRQRLKENEEEVDDNADKPLGPSKIGSATVLLAHNYEKYDIDPTGYFISEKLDGVRCFWNGTNMYSRNGNIFQPPKWFVEDWPKSQLDGELWTDRNQFEICIGIVKRQKNCIENDWKKVKYLVFDAPGLQLPFKDRYSRLETELKKLNSPYIFAVPHIKCQDMKHLQEELEKVQKKQGEGLMIRDPNSFYEHKRSATLLKVKTFHDDEAIIIGFKPSTSIANAVGAFHLRNTKGIEFYCGTGLTDQERRNPPKKGSKITYKYQNITASGKPRFPVFMRVHQQQ